MKYAIVASMMALGLAACGGGGGDTKSALVEKCVAEGESKEACGCQVDALEDALGSDTLNKLAKLGDDEGAAEALMTEIMTEKPEMAMKMGMAMMACAG